jgi:hypothetical protein
MRLLDILLACLLLGLAILAYVALVNGWIEM